MHLSQDKYTEKLVKEFRLEHSKPVPTPMPEGTVSDETSAKFDVSLYSRAIGSLLYLANGTRPDIALPVCKLSQRCKNPNVSDWEHVKYVIKRLNCTKNQGLMYEKKNRGVLCFCDANYANDTKDRKSIGGFVISLAGAPVIWSSKKQRTVSSSTVMAEYLAMYEIAKEVLWLMNFFKEINQEKFIDIPVKIYTDNQGA